MTPPSYSKTFTKLPSSLLQDICPPIHLHHHLSSLWYPTLTCQLLIKKVHILVLFILFHTLFFMIIWVMCIDCFLFRLFHILHPKLLPKLFTTQVGARLNIMKAPLIRVTLGTSRPAGATIVAKLGRQSI